VLKVPLNPNQSVSQSGWQLAESATQSLNVTQILGQCKCKQM